MESYVIAKIVFPLTVISNLFTLLSYKRIMKHLKNNNDSIYLEIKNLKPDFPKYDSSKFHRYIMKKENNLPEELSKWIRVYHYSYLFFKGLVMLLVFSILIILIALSTKYY